MKQHSRKVCEGVEVRELVGGCLFLSLEYFGVYRQCPFLFSLKLVTSIATDRSTQSEMTARKQNNPEGYIIVLAGYHILRLLTVLDI